jgi:uncharacterized SAM-binding protein YcdF (DUF218 family)
MVKPFIKLFSILMLIWAAGFYWFYQSVSQSNSCSPCKTEAIVVLTGAHGRIAYGLSLLKQDHSTVLFIAGVHPGTSKRALLKASGYRGSVDLTKVILDYTSRTTQENAQEVHQWAAKSGVRRIRLVTSNYHMPRALFEFATWAPGLTVVPDPINSLDPARQSWCKEYKVFCLYLNEYHKFIGASARQTIRKFYVKAPS